MSGQPFDLIRDSHAIDFLHESVARDSVDLGSQVRHQAVRDRCGTKLQQLLFRELFEFRTMQTDPNFANYLYRSEDEGKTWGKPIVLVDLEDATDVGYPASVQAPGNGELPRIVRSISTASRAQSIRASALSIFWA